MTHVPKDIAVSVRARLLRLAQERREDFQLLLTRYANERLLYRLAASEHGSSFVLKGATLFTVWTGQPHRATRDLDLLGFGDGSESRIRQVFEDVVRQDVPDDGVVFEATSLRVGPIREDQAYGGVRVLLFARIVTARVRIQVDIGLGDAITPAPERSELPALLDFPAPSLRTYPRETVIAEKTEAMVKLGMANSRMKDFFDVEFLARTFAFDGHPLVLALRATFERRQTEIPALPLALTSAFSLDATKQTQWKAFLRKSSLTTPARDLASTTSAIADFLLLPLEAARGEDSWHYTWAPGGPWTPGP